MTTIALFGVDRCMFASNFPVDSLCASFDDIFNGFAAITSEGFLGATFVSLVPGGDTAPLKDGDTIADTQGAMDLMSMVGQFINKSGGSPADPGATQAPAEAAPKP